MRRCPRWPRGHGRGAGRRDAGGEGGATVAEGGRGPGRRFPVVLTAGLVALLAAAAALAVFVLPSATIRIEPETSAVGPATYDIRVEGAESVSGTVEATATVTATGTYEVLEPATGFVVFFNWNVFDVEVPAETLVAAGEQAFATVETIVVPAGSLTSDGRIQAGDASMEVSAAAAGPAANVPPEAIDTILSIGTAAQLRGFPNNPERLVTNPEATSGGLEGTGTEISQADVDAANAALQQDLAEAAAAALAGTTESVCGPRRAARAGHRGHRGPRRDSRPAQRRDHRDAGV